MHYSCSATYSLVLVETFGATCKPSQDFDGLLLSNTGNVLHTKGATLNSLLTHTVRQHLVTEYFI
jgi:hypothetical protein